MKSEKTKKSADYVETIAEVFVETVQKASIKAMCCDYDREEITPSLMECLQYVYLHGGPPIREIAHGLEVSLSAASQLVDRLVKKGLLTRRESDSDRRLTKVELTVDGEEVVKQMRERRSKWFASIVDVMPEDKRQAFLEGLEGFLRIALASQDNIDHACVRCGIEHVPFCVVSEVKSERVEISEH